MKYLLKMVDDNEYLDIHLNGKTEYIPANKAGKYLLRKVVKIKHNIDCLEVWLEWLIQT